MGSAAVVLALVAVAILLTGLWIGFRHASSAAHRQLEEALAAERKLAETRESALREQLDVSRTEVANLKPKAEERERFKAQTEERDAAIQRLRDEKTELEAKLRSTVEERDMLGRKLATADQRLRDEEAKYAQMKVDLDAAFKGAAADALRANTQSFLALAKQELGGQAQDAKQTLDAKELAIKNLLDPLGAALKSLDEHSRAMEVQRSGAYSKVENLIENMQESIPASLAALTSETAQLINALRAPKTRGNWVNRDTSCYVDA